MSELGARASADQHLAFRRAATGFNAVPTSPAPLNWTDLATQEPPARRWAIRGWLGFGHVSLLVGPGGIGKSLLGQQIASALEEESVEDERYLARRKANYSPKDWRRFDYRDGVLVPDAIEASGGIVGHLREKQAERIVLDGLKRLAQMGLNATDGTTSQRFLPRLLCDYKLAEGQSRSELAAAMRRLMLDAKLRRAQVGKTGSRHPVYGLKVA